MRHSPTHHRVLAVAQDPPTGPAPPLAPAGGRPAGLHRIDSRRMCMKIHDYDYYDCIGRAPTASRNCSTWIHKNWAATFIKPYVLKTIKIFRITPSLPSFLPCTHVPLVDVLHINNQRVTSLIPYLWSPRLQILPSDCLPCHALDHSRTESRSGRDSQ